MSIFEVARKILELPPDRAAAFAEFVSPLNTIYERVKPKVPTKRELCQKLTELPVTAPYTLEVSDVLTPMRELNLGACPLTRNSMAYKAKRFRRGLLMLSIITPLKLDIFARHVKEICNAKTNLEATPRTVDLMFAKVSKLAGLVESKKVSPLRHTTTTRGKPTTTVLGPTPGSTPP